MERHARDELLHARVADERKARFDVPGRGRHIAPGERDERPLTERERQTRDRPPSLGQLGGLGQQGVGRVRRARSDRCERAEDQRRLAEWAVLRDPGQPDARVGDKRLHARGAMKPRSSATHASLLAPSGIGPRSGDRSALASHRRASRVRPSIAWTHPASTASAARRSRSPSRSNQSSQRPTVAIRPDQCIGKVYARTSRATRSMSPDACAYSTACSGSPCSAHQAAARERDLGGGARLVLFELVTEQVAEQAVIAVGAAIRIERDHEQVVPLQPPQQCQRSRRLRVRRRTAGRSWCPAPMSGATRTGFPHPAAPAAPTACSRRWTPRYRGIHPPVGPERGRIPRSADRGRSPPATPRSWSAGRRPSRTRS